MQTLAEQKLPDECPSCSISDSSPLLVAARAAAQAPGNLCSATKTGSVWVTRKRLRDRHPDLRQRSKKTCRKTDDFLFQCKPKVTHSSSPKGLHSVARVTSPCSQMSAHEVRLRVSHVPDDAVTLCPSVSAARLLLFRAQSTSALSQARRTLPVPHVNQMQLHKCCWLPKPT